MPEEVKEKIVETALRRFLQYGIRSMTIKKLVEPMGISTKTVYKYFGSKEALLAECLKILYTGYYNEFILNLNSKDGAVNKLLAVFRSAYSKDFGTSHAFFYDLNYYYPDLQNAAIERTEQNYGSMLIPLIEKGIEEGYFAKEINPAIALDGIATLYTAITRSEKYRDYHYPHELFKNLVEVYVRGMCTEKGIREIESNPYHKD
jgi:AcrR family transcriptional regulator